ncbi:hypothetical protein H4Q26_003816 [Puccinia striiformis f. sp. tritici PST-130]|nr:hypothetical protein H4Q26_003816 [Puccinia striiformis f. sp. tritici PST-130]
MTPQTTGLELKSKTPITGNLRSKVCAGKKVLESHLALKWQDEIEVLDSCPSLSITGSAQLCLFRLIENGLAFGFKHSDVHKLRRANSTGLKLYQPPPTLLTFLLLERPAS